MIRADVKEMIDFLNSLIEIDATAVTNLVNARVCCNEELAAHPTVQVRDYNLESNCEYYDVGFLGIINGYYGVYDVGDKKGYGAITAVFDKYSGLISHFRIT